MHLQLMQWEVGRCAVHLVSTEFQTAYKNYRIMPTTNERSSMAAGCYSLYRDGKHCAYSPAHAFCQAEASLGG